jgi:hypothetical protein
MSEQNDTVINGISEQITGHTVGDVIARLERHGRLGYRTAAGVYKAAIAAQQADERLRDTFRTVRNRIADAETALDSTGILNHYGIISEPSAAIDIDAARYTEALRALSYALEIAKEVLA